MKLRILIAILFLMAVSANSQVIFSNEINGTNPGLTSPYTSGQYVSSNITVTGISRGIGIVGNDANNRYNASGWNSSTINTDDYFEFKLIPNAGYRINFESFTFTGQTSTAGPKNFSLRSSIDNFASGIGGISGAGTTAQLVSPTFQNITSAITFRIYGWGATNIGGTFSVNDFRFNGLILPGTCALTTTITPLSGPINTVVQVTATMGNLVGANAFVDGIPAVVEYLNNEQMFVTIPVGATLGNILIVNSLNCSTLKNFSLTTKQLTGCQGAANATDLFISEFNDSTYGNLQYIELFNGTPNPINLENYSLGIANNGGVITTPTPLDNFLLAPGSTYVIAVIGSALCPTVPGGDGSYASQIITSGINFEQNKNDFIGLYKNGTLLDSFGVLYNSAWADILGLDGEGGVSFIRRTTAIVPLTTYSNSDWIITDVTGTGSGSCPNNNYTTIGSHQFTSGTPPIVNNQPSYSPSCLSTTLSVAASEGFIGGNALAYQWFYAAPGNTTWDAVPNSAPFSGVTTANLQISDVTSLNNYQFYAQVRENTATCYTATHATIIRVPTNVWNGAWLPATPTSSSLVRITTNYDTALQGNIDACSIVVVNGATLRIAPENYAFIQNNLEVQTGATLIVENNGSLVMERNTGAVINNGVTNVRRTTTTYKKFDYTYWSTPVTSPNIATTFAGWRLDYGFTFNPATYTDLNHDGFDDDNNSWIPIATPTMTSGVGYAIMMPTTAPSYPAPGTTINFSGAVNNGIINVPVALSANPAPSEYDFNLIGNPYPSAIDGTLLIQNNTTLNTLYFWTHRTAIASTPGPNVYNFTVDDYATFNLSGGTASDSGSLPPTGNIASGQGFFTDVTANGTVQFRNEFRSKAYLNNDFYKNQQVQRDRIWLNFESQQGLFSQLLVGYFPEATSGIDRGYDGATLASQNSVSFYSLINGNSYRIQGKAPFSISDLVPLGFKAVAGTYHISIPFKEGQLSTLSEIYLEDKQLGVIHNLNEGNYTFTTMAGTFNQRFVLRYTTESLGIDEQILGSDVQFITKDHRLIIRSANEMTNVQLYDMLGRKVFESKIDGAAFSTYLPSVNGTLVAKITFADAKQTTRKIVF